MAHAIKNEIFLRCNISEKISKCCSKLLHKNIFPVNGPFSLLQVWMNGVVSKLCSASWIYNKCKAKLLSLGLWCRAASEFYRTGTKIASPAGIFFVPVIGLLSLRGTRHLSNQQVYISIRSTYLIQSFVQSIIEQN